MGGGQEIGGGRQALNEGAVGGHLLVPLGWAFSCLPIINGHVAAETLDPITYASVEKPSTGKAPLSYRRCRGELCKGRNAKQFTCVIIL